MRHHWERDWLPATVRCVHCGVVVAYKDRPTGECTPNRCSGCSDTHPGEVCPNRPDDDDDPRMADLYDDAPQHEGEV